MNIHQVQQLLKHLVDALFALLHVLISEFEHLLTTLVDTIARGPDDERECD